MRKTHNHDGINNSMVDLMTSLAVIFILLLVAYLNKAVYEKGMAQKVIGNLLAGTRTKRDDLKNTLGTIGIAAEQDPKDPLLLTIRIGGEKLQFDHDMTALKPEGMTFLKAFVPKLAAVLTSPEYSDKLQSVLIEGHTDSDGNDEHNLRLSQGRSYSVLLYIIHECGLPNEQRMKLLKLISASGRGESELIKDPIGRENKELSRRVSLKIRITSIEQQNMPELEKFISPAVKAKAKNNG